jgi:hypothetical protein
MQNELETDAKSNSYKSRNAIITMIMNSAMTEKSLNYQIVVQTLFEIWTCVKLWIFYHIDSRCDEK